MKNNICYWFLRWSFRLSGLGCLLILSGCGEEASSSSGDRGTDSAVAETFEDRLTEVDTAILHKGIFHNEIISQGRVAALRKIEVPFTAQGIVTEVAVSDGQYVEKGDLLVALDDFTIRNQLEKLAVQKEQAHLNMENHFINLGYDPERPEEIPEEIRKNATVEFNLSSLAIEEDALENELAGMRITAPFSGMITGLRLSEGAHTSAYEKVCVLVDTRQLVIRFPVLESEVQQVKKGQEIRIEPVYQSVQPQSATGRITLISPVVNDKGMVECEAVPGQGNIPFRDGMRVNVNIRDAVPDVLVLPKSAVVDRQNRLVVFTLSGEHRAQWNYVEIGGENSEVYLIREGLQAGDTVIMTNNRSEEHTAELQSRGHLGC